MANYRFCVRIKQRLTRAEPKSKGFVLGVRLKLMSVCCAQELKDNHSAVAKKIRCGKFLFPARQYAFARCKLNATRPALCSVSETFPVANMYQNLKLIPADSEHISIDKLTRIQKQLHVLVKRQKCVHGAPMLPTYIHTQHILMCIQMHASLLTTKNT